jgi:uncharacterized protein involved in response to NO
MRPQGELPVHHADADAKLRLLPPNTALFALGFRPFFLLAGTAAVALAALWVAAYVFGLFPANNYYDMLGWHSHEMVFGYGVAVVAGFLLTSVKNWTGIQTVQGKGLAALTALWLGGRVLPFFSGTLPHGLIALVDLAFLPALAMALAIPLLRHGQQRNLIFLPILAVMALANGMVHLQVLGLTGATARAGTYVAVDLIILLIAIIGGRVIPFFTERALPGATPRRWPVIERVSIVAVVVLALSELLELPTAAVAAIAVLGALSHAIRWWGWHERRVWSVPLLWVLYLGYGWVVVGFALKALAAAGQVTPFLALHAFTVGGIGVMTLGIMARVALGHTGRPLQPAKAAVWAFALINLATLARVALPLEAPRWYVSSIALAGGLWMAAFLLFLAVYAPILIRPRVDGRPG